MKAQKENKLSLKLLLNNERTQKRDIRVFTVFSFVTLTAVLLIMRKEGINLLTSFGIVFPLSILALKFTLIRKVQKEIRQRQS